MIYRKIEYLETPHGNSSVWRYIADWKLESLLKGSELFFTNATKLSDQYEVTIPKSTIVSKRKALKNSELNEKELNEELAIFHWDSNPMKDLVLVNCWSISPHESYALWKIYLGEKKNGIAIKSTVSSVKEAVENGGDKYPEEFFIGKIKYKSHLKLDEVARLSVITTKKPYYDFENELRLFILNYPRSEGGTETPYDIKSGRTVKVNLSTLINEIYISPFADPSYEREVGKLLRSSKIGLSKLKHSDIRDK